MKSANTNAKSAKGSTVTNNADPIMTGIGVALCAMLDGARGKRPKVKLPPLADCPFCGSKAELRYTPLPAIGCSNEDCAARPAVTFAYTLFKGIKANTAKGLRTMASLWNTRAPAKSCKK